MAQTDLGGTETPLSQDPGTFPVFHLPVAEDGAVVLPDDLRRRLRLEHGDTLAFSVSHGSAFVTRTTRLRRAEPVEYEETPPLAGLLKDYFTDRDDVQRFIEDERSGWEEREEMLGQ